MSVICDCELMLNFVLCIIMINYNDNINDCNNNNKDLEY